MPSDELNTRIDRLQRLVMQERSVDLVELGPFLNLVYTDDQWYAEFPEQDKNKTIYDLAKHQKPRLALVADPVAAMEIYDIVADPFHFLLMHYARTFEEFTVCDIGAQYGSSAMETMLRLRALKVNVRMFAFEPGIAGALTPLNFENNGFPEIGFHRAAVGPVDGYVVLHRELGSSEDNRIVNPLRSRERGSLSVPVKCVRLDTFLTQHHGFGPALVKIDTQGAEPGVIAGMAELIKQHPVSMFLEYLPKAIQNVVEPAAFIRSLLATHYCFDTGINGSQLFEVTTENVEAHRQAVARSSDRWVDLLLVAKTLPDAERVCQRIRAVANAGPIGELTEVAPAPSQTSAPAQASASRVTVPEDPIAVLIRRFADTDGTAIDIGANQGLYTRVLCESFERVVAFEPNPKVHPVLRQNITAGNVTFEARAVSDTNGEIKFYLDLRADLGGVASSVNQLADLGGQTEEIVVPCTTLDAYCAEHSLTPSFIKIDVEGHEPQVIAGAMQTIRRARPVIVMEFWESWYDLGYGDLFRALEPLYELYVVGTEESVREKYINPEGALTAPAKGVDIYAVPRGAAGRSRSGPSGPDPALPDPHPPPVPVRPAPTLQQLRELTNSARHAEAAALLDGVDLAAEHDADLLYYAGVCLGSVGQHERAIDLLMRAAAGGFAAFWCAYHLALFEMRRGRPASAAYYYAVSLILDPQRADIYPLLQRVAPDVDPSLLREAQGGVRSAQAARAAVALATASSAHGRFGAAAFYCAAALALDPENEAARDRLGELTPEISFLLLPGANG